MLQKYRNGNAEISIDTNGDRVIEYEDVLQLDYPLNIDIRVSSACSFGRNPTTGKAFCSFCHESATTNGAECDYDTLKEKLADLPQGIELAIGCNNLTDGLWQFLIWCKLKGYIANLTINQGHLKRDLFLLNQAINYNYLNGLGVSYRSELKWDVSQEIIEYPNTVFHVIAGIDTFAEVAGLVAKGVKKILILGEKDFGFNVGKVDLTTRNHREWFWWVHKLFSQFEVVSFDNLAIEQLNIRRFFTDENWGVFNQGEHSFYINAVEQFFSPSSRDSRKTDWNDLSVREYFLTK